MWLLCMGTIMRSTVWVCAHAKNGVTHCAAVLCQSLISFVARRNGMPSSTIYRLAMKLATVALALCCLTSSTGPPTHGNVLAPGNNNNAELCASVTRACRAGRRPSGLCGCLSPSTDRYYRPVAIGGGYLKFTFPRIVTRFLYAEADMLPDSRWNYTLTALNLSHRHAMLTTADGVKLNT